MVSTPTVSDPYTNFGLAFVPQSDGSVQFYCGHWNETPTAQTLEILPSSCSQTDLAYL